LTSLTEERNDACESASSDWCSRASSNTSRTRGNGDFLAWILTIGGAAVIVGYALFFWFLDKKIDVSGKKTYGKPKR
jgi:hypothetical protein